MKKARKEAKIKGKIRQIKICVRVKERNIPCSPLNSMKLETRLVFEPVGCAMSEVLPTDNYYYVQECPLQLWLSAVVGQRTCSPRSHSSALLTSWLKFSFGQTNYFYIHLTQIIP
jgi:hypothetical protein